MEVHGCPHQVTNVVRMKDALKQKTNIHSFIIDALWKIILIQMSELFLIHHISGYLYIMLIPRILPLNHVSNLRVEWFFLLQNPNESLNLHELQESV